MPFIVTQGQFPSRRAGGLELTLRPQLMLPPNKPVGKKARASMRPCAYATACKRTARDGCTNLMCYRIQARAVATRPVRWEP
eukprot:8715243-Lingulodinium_polyedra.AAC.1